MSSTTFIDLRINNAALFKKSVSDTTANNQIYLTIGKIESWANDSNPPTANSAVTSIYEIWDNMIGGKRLFGGDLSHIIRRINWQPGTTYDAYDHQIENMYSDDMNFYIINSENNVYKCISNNKIGNLVNTSEYEPLSVDPDICTYTADGYIWKYMYNITSAELLRYATDDYIPVKTLSGDDGSDQWKIQRAAISGSIECVKVLDPGYGYTNADNIIINTYAGDGKYFAGRAVINSTTSGIDSITITDRGVDYSFLELSVLDSSNEPGDGCVVKAIISPPNGHGSNPLSELGGKDLMIDARIRSTENDTLPLTNDYRQISLLLNPKIKNTQNNAVTPSFSQAYKITVFGSGDYRQDEYVYQGQNLNNAFFKGRVLSWDAATSTLLLINIKGQPTASFILVGDLSATVRTVSSIQEEYLEKHSGQILYCDNRKPISRAEDQIENFKIIMKY